MSFFEPPTGTREYHGEETRRLENARSDLVELYTKWGYSQIIPSRLERYETLITLISPEFRRRLLTLTTPYGELVSLRGEMTVAAASTLRNRFSTDDRPVRFFYIERIVRSTSDTTFEGIQAGLEIMGSDALESDIEVIYLLRESLRRLGVPAFRIALSDSDIIDGIISSNGFTDEQRRGLLRSLSIQSAPELESLLSGCNLPAGEARFMKKLFSLRGNKVMFDEIRPMLSNARSSMALERLESLWSVIESLGMAHDFILDFSLIRELGYYSGPIFEALTMDIGAPLGGGGRYDLLLRKMGMLGSASGFAVDMDAVIEASCTQSQPVSSRTGISFPWNNEAMKFAYDVAEHLHEKNIESEFLPCHLFPKGSMHFCVKKGIDWLFLLDASGLECLIDTQTGMRRDISSATWDTIIDMLRGTRGDTK